MELEYARQLIENLVQEDLEVQSLTNFLRLGRHLELWSVGVAAQKLRIQVEKIIKRGTDSMLLWQREVTTTTTTWESKEETE
jgi:hypothetical protein